MVITNRNRNILVGFLVVWFVGWFVGWLVDRLENYSGNLLVVELVN